MIPLTQPECQPQSRGWAGDDIFNMKNIPLLKLKAALKKCRDIEAGIVTDKIHLAVCLTEQTALAAGLEFTDHEALTRMAQLQVVAAIAPQRMEARQAGLEQARQELVAAEHEFIRLELRPRCLELRERAKTRTQKSLKAHYRNEEDLEAAVNASALMMTMERIQEQAIIGGSRTDNCEEKAARLIQAWDETNQFERAHLN